jgi:hypothetical protein
LKLFLVNDSGSFYLFLYTRLDRTSLDEIYKFECTVGSVNKKAIYKSVRAIMTNKMVLNTSIFHIPFIALPVWERYGHLQLPGSSN